MGWGAIRNGHFFVMDDDAVQGIRIGGTMDQFQMFGNRLKRIGDFMHQG